MKKLTTGLLVIAIMAISWKQTVAQDASTVQEVCLGTGVHCATLNYGTIKMTFVKSKNAPGIRIKEVKEVKSEK
ncbi:hypothetical protein [Fulvivirga sedimenti]|uniref:DUF1496 domain-containing protein n=1 Tax=Fulvivirga sedimenti TaxID=2879465 RepID=A0A9X1HL34_9BACT|nr:hypothetical protein [Fulvivirga sedimenti]MCA6074158.1 hypothetical protein [Fulvivirga sedimenti]